MWVPPSSNNNVTDFPRFTDINEALFRRVVVIPFPFLFREPQMLDPNNPYHRPIDETLSQKAKDPEFVLEMMNMLIHYCEIYKREGLVMPEYVLNATKRYQKEMSEVFSWVHEKIEPAQDELIPISILYDDFMYDKKMTITRTELSQTKFTTTLSKYYTIERRRYKGSEKQSCIMNYKLINLGCVVE
jgi:phage/plasmid-associated DNA primase